MFEKPPMFEKRPTSRGNQDMRNVGTVMKSKAENIAISDRWLKDQISMLLIYNLHHFVDGAL